MAVTRYALLLRGINLGRVNKVPMADLRALLAEEGYAGVATLLQSGNVVLDAGLPAPALARSVERAIRQRFGFHVDVVVRTRDEIHQVLAKDPLGGVATQGATYYVAFMAEPAVARVEEVLGAIEVGDDRWVVDGAEIYVWSPHGMRGSPVMAALGRAKKGPPTTVRNWNTVQKLARLL